MEAVTSTFCESCGGPARVRVLNGYVRGQPRYHLYCVACADRSALPADAPRARGHRRSMAPVATLSMLAVGLATAGLAVERLLSEPTAWAAAPGAAVAGGCLISLIVARRPRAKDAALARQGAP